MLRHLPLLAAIPLTIAVGVFDGLWTDRWQNETAAQEAASRLATVPADIGEWTSEALEMDARQVQRAEASGYLLRRYSNPRTGQALTVMIVCGRPGPISLHTPDMCYQGRGYKVEGDPVVHTLPREEGGPATQLLRATFNKSGPSPEPLRIFWSWSAGQGWSVPARPRVAFARSPALYKLYVIQTLAQPNEPLEQSPVPEFLQHFLPQLEQCLFPAS